MLKTVRAAQKLAVSAPARLATQKNWRRLLTSVVIALAGHAISDTRWEQWGVAPPTTFYAPFWALFILLDIPLAIVSWWYGPIVLVVVFGVLWVKLPNLRLGVALTT